MTRPLAIFALGVLALGAWPVRAQSLNATQPVVTPPPASSSVLTLSPGQSRILRFPTVNRAAIGNPAVADLAVLSKTELLLNAKSAGETLLYVQNARGAASITIRVAAPVMDNSAMERSLNDALDGTGVSATVAGNAVFLRGTVDGPEQEQRAVAAARAMSPNVVSLINQRGPDASALAETLRQAFQPMNITVRPSGNVIVLEGSTTTENLAVINRVAGQLGTGFQVVNLVNETVSGRQVVVHARIVDVDQGALREIGIDWGRFLVDDNGAVTGVAQPIFVGEVPSINADGGLTSQPRQLDQAGSFLRLDNIGAALRALEQGDRAKILSAPDVLVQDNNRAEIVVGGQIPVPVPQVGAGANTIVIEYREYGVKLFVTPRVLPDGTVSMRVQPEVSTLDYTNAVVLSGFRIPAFRVRRADTQVTVASGQTLVIGGLLQDQDVDTMRKIPILSEIPLLGELFKFRSKSRLRTQLVILVTPEVLAPGVRPPLPPLAALQPDSVRLPGMVGGGSRNDPPNIPNLAQPGMSPIPPTPGGENPR